MKTFHHNYDNYNLTYRKQYLFVVELKYNHLKLWKETFRMF